MKRAGDIYLLSAFLEMEPIMEDFPIWLKIIVWTIVGGTAVYMLAAMIHFGLLV
ncbi:MAG: hypothetical protein OEN50_02180 [Deltaproteobacteria bacterium]|nr:hypothetical protein [Deltaproteobacteria bacterium]